MTVLLCAVVGAVGCVARYGAEVLSSFVGPRNRLYGTMAVNALGCFVFSVSLNFGARHGWVQHHTALYVQAFCGGLTTFSAAFAGPWQQMSQGERRSAILSLGATPLLCFGAYWLATTLI